MKYLFETQRLRYRPFTSSDFGNILELDSDPEVMKYINGGKPTTTAEVEATLKRVSARYLEFPGMGSYITELKSTGDFIGWHSLKPLPGTNEIEVGYRLLKRHWGKGYATEGARFFVQRGLKELNLPRVVAITAIENTASQSVLTKSGFSYINDRDFVYPNETPIRIKWFEAVDKRV